MVFSFQNNSFSFDEFCPPLAIRVKEFLNHISLIRTPHPCVWSDHLTSSNDSIDQQHSLLLSSLDRLEVCCESPSYSCKVRDTIRPRLQHIVELWESHLHYETSLNSNEIIPDVIQSETCKSFDIFALRIFKMALQACDDIPISTDISSREPHDIFLYRLVKILQKIIFRHIILTSIVVKQGSKKNSLLDSCDLQLCKEKNRTLRSALVHSTTAYFSSLKNVSNYVWGYLTYWYNNDKKDKHYREGVFATQNSSYPVLTQCTQNHANHLATDSFFSSRFPELIVSILDSAEWDDQDSTKNDSQQNSVDDSDFTAFFKHELPLACTIRTKPSVSSYYSDAITGFKRNKKKVHPNQTTLIDISQYYTCSFTINQDSFFNKYYDKHISFKTASEAFKMATLLIDIRKRCYRMIRGDVVLKNMTLYQPWDLAGQHFEYLLSKKGQVLKHEALLIDGIKKFFRKCSRYRLNTNSKHNNFVPHLVERVTIQKQDDTYFSVIAVFLLVIAQAKTHVLCILFDKLNENVMLPYPCDSPDYSNSFFVWLANRFVAGGHVYKRLFAEPFI